MIEYEPIGRARVSRSKHWFLEAHATRRALKTVSAAMFMLGMMCGLFVGFYI